MHGADTTSCGATTDEKLPRTLTLLLAQATLPIAVPSQNEQRFKTTDDSTQAADPCPGRATLLENTTPSNCAEDAKNTAPPPSFAKLFVKVQLESDGPSPPSVLTYTAPPPASRPCTVLLRNVFPSSSADDLKKTAPPPSPLIAELFVKMLWESDGPSPLMVEIRSTNTAPPPVAFGP
mmetsp:Transcript_8758/g.19001  ORF Transcript_8758/g.19001 Transcript_8758/m.19001 type:complete len:178 (-) Transcript_8758:141-674(-)